MALPAALPSAVSDLVKVLQAGGASDADTAASLRVLLSAAHPRDRTQALAGAGGIEAALSAATVGETSRNFALVSYPESSQSCPCPGLLCRSATDYCRACPRSIFFLYSL